MDSNCLFFFRHNRLSDFSINENDRFRYIAKYLNQALKNGHNEEHVTRIAQRFTCQAEVSGNVLVRCDCYHYSPACDVKRCDISGKTFCKNNPFCSQRIIIDGAHVHISTTVDFSEHVNICPNCNNYTYRIEGEECFACDLARDMEENHSSDLYKYHQVKAEVECKWYPERNDGKTETLPYLGIELEVECHADSTIREAVDFVKNRLDGHAILMEDSTISRGFEIISSPHTIDEHYKAPWKSIFNGSASCIKAGSSHIGLHVNLSRSSVSTLEMGKMFYYIHRHFPLVEKLARRTESDWARFKKDTRKIRKDVFLNTNHRDALNIHDDVLEFRMFRSTLNELFFFASLEAVLAMRKLAKEASIRQLDDASTFLEVARNYEFPALREYLIYLNLMKRTSKLRMMPGDKFATPPFPCGRQEH